MMLKLDELKGTDFFEADGRSAAERAVAEALRAVSADEPAHAPAPSRRHNDLGIGRTWVTRPGVKVDRIACAWLIRRFIDPDARFAFVSSGAAELTMDMIRFDMFEGEFTHVGDSCTFETLLVSFDLEVPGLEPLAEIVHDLDNKDGKYGRPEAAGVGALIDGIVRTTPDDGERIARGATLLDALLEHFRA
jgi:hypothetical protein